MEPTFWILLGTILYVYVGYPVVLAAMGGSRARKPDDDFAPTVSLFVPAHNEENVIREKIENSLSLDYPVGKFDIVVASDGSTDSTGKIAKSYQDRGVAYFESEERGGKNNLINRFIDRCKGEIIVFTDANTFYKPDALRKLVRHFSDDKVGCVVGNLRYVDEKSAVGKGEGLYFRYEAMIKRLESALGTLVAASGSIYAIRKSMFIPLDNDVANDFAHPIQAAALEKKIVFEPEAAAWERATESAAEEYRRRKRIVTRGVTAFFRYRKRYRMLQGRWGFCFISHKLLRWFLPFLMIALFITNAFLVHPVYRVILFAQLVFYSMAAIGFASNKKLGKPFYVPFYFCLINISAMKGIIDYFGGERKALWEAAKTTR